MSVREGLRILLAGTGLVARGDPASAAVITIVAASDGPSAAAQQGGYVANEIVVTAQKRVESIQDVPIAMTALSSEELHEQKMETRSDLICAGRNLTFSHSKLTTDRKNRV